MRGAIRVTVTVGWLMGCTAIRPLGPDASVEIDAGRAGDAGVRVDAEARPPDAGARDAGALADGALADGGCDDPRIGSACDGPDGDGCLEGVWACGAGGVAVCDDDTDDSLEMCTAGDEDCDGRVDEGPPPDATIWGLDEDRDRYGSDAMTVTACAPPTSEHVARLGDCDDGDDAIFPGAMESCDGVDQDCDAAVDEGTSCGSSCTRVANGADTYQLCTGPLTWTEARTLCQGFGYDLVVIQNAPENGFLQARAAMIPVSDGGAWWIGLRRAALFRPHEWVDGSAPMYTNWATGEPDMGDLYVRLASLTGNWSDVSFGGGANAICEAP